MKIAQVIPAFAVAGAEIMCENLIYAEMEAGHEVVVISMYDYHSPITDRLEARGIDIKYLGKKRGLDLSMIGKMKRIFESECVEAVHTHLYAAKYAMIAARRAGVPARVHTVHNIAKKESGGLSRLFNRFLFKHRGVVPVALSEIIRSTVCSEYRMSEDKVPVVFNGIDLSKYVPKESYEINGSFKILHIGRFSEQKNHKGLLLAFSFFYKKHSDSELWLIGDGELREEIMSYAVELGICGAVKFLGIKKNVGEYLSTADVFALPSVYEGVPMTLIEAMAAALPIVATAVGGVPDMLDLNSAILCEVDAKQIAHAFEKYYNDKALRCARGASAKQKSLAFSSTEMGERYIEIYASKINERKNGKRAKRD